LTKYPKNTEENPIVKDYISFAIKNPNLLGFTISNITWYLENNNIEIRRQSLSNEMIKYNHVLDAPLELRLERIFSSTGNHNICKMFLEKGYPSLSETVALLRISFYLLSLEGHPTEGITTTIIIIILYLIIIIILLTIIVFGNNYSTFKSLLYSYVSKDRLSFSDATMKLLKKKAKRPRPSRRRIYHDYHNYHNYDDLGWDDDDDDDYFNDN